MLEWIKENSIAFTIAVILHLLFVGTLLFNWEFDQPKKIVLKQGEIIQTTAVDANSFNAKIAQIEQQKKAEQQRKAAELRRKQELKEKKRKEALRRKQEQKRKAEEQKRKTAEAARKKEQQRKAALLKEKKLLEQKLLEQKRKEAARKAAEERKRAEKKKAEAKRKAEEQKRREAEKKRKEEQKRIAEAKRTAEAKRKAEAEKKRQAELKRQQERERAERERLSRGIVNKHVALIAQKIERNWRQPPGTPANLQCKIDIRLRPSGEVISVKIAESSGNIAFDRSVETAVRRASPLPVPRDSVIFKQFEVMRLRFEPGSY